MSDAQNEHNIKRLYYGKLLTIELINAQVIPLKFRKEFTHMDFRVTYLLIYRLQWKEHTVALDIK